MARKTTATAEEPGTPGTSEGAAVSDRATGKTGGTGKRGGLPEDNSLGAFSVDTDAALAAFAPRERTGRRTVDRVAEGSARAVGDGGVASPAAPVPVRAVEVPPVVRDGGGTAPTQCTVMVEREVRERFVHYQTLAKAQTGREPTNAVVVRRAFLAAKRRDQWAQLQERVRSRRQPLSEEDYDPDGLFGDVPARRVERGGVKNSTQQSFRPSEQELRVYDAYAAAHGFANRSDFLDAVLDAFLPVLPGGRRAGR